jgi:hypothetical protein
VNRGIEAPAIKNFAFFRSIWGIRGRRDDPIHVPATVKFAGREHKLNLNEHGQPNLIISTERDDSGRKSYKIFGPPESVEAKQIEIERKNPAINWTEFDIKNVDPPESLVEFKLDLEASHLRRLAAKVAFERFAQMRSSEFVADDEFNEIRNFIRDGKEANVCCGVLADLALLKGSLNFLPPRHAVAVIAHPKDRVLGAFVSLFSLFYYWVILSTTYRALGPTDDLLLEHPQARDSETPLLRQGTGSVRIRWDPLITDHRQHSKEKLKLAAKYAVEKFQDLSDKFYAKQK